MIADVLIAAAVFLGLWRLKALLDRHVARDARWHASDRFYHHETPEE